VKAVYREKSAPDGARSRCGHGQRGFRLALSIAATMLAAPAVAAPRTIDGCEALKEANAYNLCLASFGPMRGQHGATYPGLASEREKAGGSAVHDKSTAHNASKLGYGANVRHGANGRMRMEFTPGRR
jgi:hypothetical protein